MFRILKSLLVLFIGLHALFYALQNLANFGEAQAALGYVMSGADHAAYPHTLFFKSGSSALHLAALILVLIGEFSVAFFGIKGGWDLFAARNGTPEKFRTAKSAGLWAAGIALLTWFGLFMAFGGAFFQMWQTQVGDGSLRGAFYFAAISVLTMLFVVLTPDDQASTA
ncbi:MAG TPA: DUF2165 family protein [Sphingomicrobium sp.]|nr:DUF2165 family protein [Sphingomicrobium sp.]